MMEGYKDTEIGIFPKTWSVMYLGEFANIHNNKRYPISSEIRINKKGIFPYCGANGIVDFIDEYKFDGEFILMAEDGGNFHDYQTKPIAYLMQGKFWVNNHAHVLSAKNGVNKFLFYSLEHKDITKYIIGSTRTKLNRSVLESILIAVPPLPEQQKIAEILSTIDEKIEVIEAQINQTTELKKGLMQQLLTKGIGHTKFKDSPLGKIPESWKVVKLGDLLKKSPEYGANASAVPYSGNTYRYIRITDIDDDGNLIPNSIMGISKDIGEDYKLNDGDILIARTGNTVGKSYMHNKSNGECAFAGYLIRFTCDKKILLPNFLIQFLHSRLYWTWVNSTLRTGAQPNINSKEYQSIKISLPTINEQSKIAEVLVEFDKKIESLKSRVSKFQEFKKGLMQQLLTGKLRVNLNPTNHAAKSGKLQAAK